MKINGRRVPLYSIAHHPLDPEFCLCGRDQYIRIYDKRNCKNPVQRLAPEHMNEVTITILLILFDLNNF